MVSFYVLKICFADKNRSHLAEHITIEKLHEKLLSW